MSEKNSVQFVEQPVSLNIDKNEAVDEKPKRGRKPGNTAPTRIELYCPSCNLSLLTHPGTELTCTRCTIPLIPAPKNKEEFKAALNKAYETINQLRKLNTVLLQEKEIREGIQPMQ